MNKKLPPETIELIKQLEFDGKNYITNLEHCFNDKWEKCQRLSLFDFMDEPNKLRIKQKQYRPYETVKLEWLGKEVIKKLSKEINWIKFVGINKIYLNSITYTHMIVPLEEMYEQYTWADGSVFGEEI